MGAIKDSDPSLRALLASARAYVRATSQKSLAVAEARRVTAAAPLRNPAGPVTRPPASLADVLGVRRADRHRKP